MTDKEAMRKLYKRRGGMGKRFTRRLLNKYKSYRRSGHGVEESLERVTSLYLRPIQPGYFVKLGAA